MKYLIRTDKWAMEIDFFFIQYSEYIQTKKVFLTIPTVWNLNEFNFFFSPRCLFSLWIIDRGVTSLHHQRNLSRSPCMLSSMVLIIYVPLPCFIALKLLSFLLWRVFVLFYLNHSLDLSTCMLFHPSLSLNFILIIIKRSSTLPFQ